MPLRDRQGYRLWRPTQVGAERRLARSAKLPGDMSGSRPAEKPASARPTAKCDVPATTGGAVYHFRQQGKIGIANRGATTCPFLQGTSTLQLLFPLPRAPGTRNASAEAIAIFASPWAVACSGSTMHTKLTTAARTLLVAGAILLPALLNGRPFLFEDSFGLFQYRPEPGRGGIQADLWRHGCAARGQGAGSAGGAGKPSLHPTNGPGDGLTTLAGARSPVYSLLVYIASANLSTWAVAVIQAVLVAWLLVSFLSAAWGTKKALPVFMVALLLSIFSSLGFMAAFVMPDIFCAVMVLASARRAAEPDMSGPEKLVLSGLVIVSAFMHSSNLRSAWTYAGRSLGLEMAVASVACPGVATDPDLAVAVVAGVTLKFAYAAAVTRVTGQPLGSPPFLMARIIADGPGARYLTEACANDPKSFRVWTCRRKNIGIMMISSGAAMARNAASPLSRVS